MKILKSKIAKCVFGMTLAFTAINASATPITICFGEDYCIIINLV